MHCRRLLLFLIGSRRAILLGRVVINVILLARERIKNGEQPGLAEDGLHNGLHTLLKLLLIESHARHGQRRDFLLLLGSQRSTQAKTLELLGCCCHADQLLLEALLLGSQEEVRRHKFRVETFVDVHVVADVERRGCKDLLGKCVHRATLVCVLVLVHTERVARETSSHSGLRDPFCGAIRVVAVAITFHSKLVLTLGCRRHGG